MPSSAVLECRVEESAAASNGNVRRRRRRQRMPIEDEAEGKMTLTQALSKLPITQVHKYMRQKMCWTILHPPR